MTPSVGVTTGGTVAAGMMVVAQELGGTPLNADVLLLTIFSLGSGIIAWLVRREANDRKIDQAAMEHQNEARRKVDQQREDRIKYLEAENARLVREQAQLYERFIRVAHAVHPDHPFPEPQRKAI